MITFHAYPPIASVAKKLGGMCSQVSDSVPHKSFVPGSAFTQELVLCFLYPSGFSI